MKTILFDLDGTLLKMDQDKFTKYYIGLISEYFKDTILPENMTKGLLGGMKAMIMNDGSCTNEEAFFEVFYKAIGKVVETSEFIPFYLTDFKKTVLSCTVDNDARELIDMLKEKGYRIVLASNPLFPSIATETRMGFVGLKPDDFELVTTYEKWHHCKPNLDYYREILEAINEKPENIIMVGNDVDEDLISKELGFEVALITDCLLNRHNKELKADFVGTMKEFIEEVRTNY